MEADNRRSRERKIVVRKSGAGRMSERGIQGEMENESEKLTK